MKTIFLFVALLSVIGCLSEWQSHIQAISEQPEDYSSMKLMQEVTLLGVEIDKEASGITMGIDLVKFAGHLKNTVRMNPKLPIQITTLLESKSQVYHNQGSRKILVENPSMFDDL